MMRRAILASVIMFSCFFAEAQNYILQNNKYFSVTPTYSVNFSTGEMGSMRKKFFADYENIQESKGIKINAKFNPRHSIGFAINGGVQFNPHIYLAFKLNYNRLGQHESFTQIGDNGPNYEHDLHLKMDYLGAGINLVLFHPKNFKIEIGYSNNYNIKDKVIITTESSGLPSGETMYFSEYFKKERKAFLGCFTFGTGYLYKSIGIDIQCSYSRNIFLENHLNQHFLTTSIGFTYYLVKNKDNFVVEKEEEIK